MEFDKRIAEIMRKMERLSEKHPLDTCGEFPPKWDEPISEERVRKFEEQNGIKLPEDYRRFITTVAKSGTQPFYGLISIDGKREPDFNNGLTADLTAKFPYTLNNPLDIESISDEEYRALFDEDSCDYGFIALCDEGCGMFNILIVNSDDAETYGTVWFYDLANDAGIFPLIDPKTGKAMRFLDWLEYFADRSYELDDDDYFSYAELCGGF